MRKCKDGSHSLVEVQRTETNEWLADEVTKWCKRCGAIVIDKEVDGRTISGFYMRMNFPEITKKKAKK